MNPDLDLRLKSVMKALAEVILPALPPEQRMARDQTHLALGHLALLAEQWPYALRYELESLDECLELASALAPQVRDPSLAAALIDSVARAKRLMRDDYAAVGAALHAVKAAIDHALADGEGETPLSAAVLGAVLRYNARRAPRERSWHRASGLDPDGPRLPRFQDFFDRG
ncbi:MAG: hypothetical protein K2Y51_03050 [Gammaproteobacteria bacterium]|nr:hypothetical protein [Gammaproteobacteria bacterium]